MAKAVAFSGRSPCFELEDSTLNDVKQSRIYEKALEGGHGSQPLFASPRGTFVIGSSLCDGCARLT
jgi:hypothetical protein